MKLAVEWHNDQFNLSLSSKDGAEPFLTVRGCRIKSGSKGQFVSWPATKNERSGKWWNHVVGSDAFQAAVIKAAEEAMPKSQQSACSSA
jgi:hypothetical protein